MVHDCSSVGFEVDAKPQMGFVAQPELIIVDDVGEVDVMVLPQRVDRQPEFNYLFLQAILTVPCSWPL